MQRIRRGRIGARLCAVLIFAALLAVAGRAGLAGATPSPSGQSPGVTTPTPTASTGGGLTLKIGSLGVNLNLPLEIPGLLTVGNGTSTSSGTPSSSPTSGTSTSAAPPSSTSAQPSRSRTVSHSAARPAQGGFGAPPVTPTGHRHRGTHSASPTATKSHHHDGPAGAIVLTKRLLANDPVLLLASILAALVLGVALFVRLSGRRGGHQA